MTAYLVILQDYCSEYNYDVRIILALTCPEGSVRVSAGHTASICTHCGYFWLVLTADTGREHELGSAIATWRVGS